MPDRLTPHPPTPPDLLVMPRRVQQRPHRCPSCGTDLEWDARSRVEHFSWDHFHCPGGCGRFYLQSGAHLIQALE